MACAQLAFRVEIAAAVVDAPLYAVSYDFCGSSRVIGGDFNQLCDVL